MIFTEVLDDEIIQILQQDYENTTTHGNIHDVISWMKVISKHLIISEQALTDKKLEYEQEFNLLCLSKEYEIRFKTIKAREQQASIELIEKQEYINQLKMLVKLYNAELEILRYELKLLEKEL